MSGNNTTGAHARSAAHITDVKTNMDYQKVSHGIYYPHLHIPVHLIEKYKLDSCRLPYKIPAEDQKQIFHIEKKIDMYHYWIDFNKAPDHLVGKDRRHFIKEKLRLAGCDDGGYVCGGPEVCQAHGFGPVTSHLITCKTTHCLTIMPHDDMLCESCKRWLESMNVDHPGVTKDWFMDW
jgi:hypothetical protein